MGRARDRSAARPRHTDAATDRAARAGGTLRRDRRAAGVTAVLSAALACSQLSPDLDSIIALAIALPDSGFLELGDTLYPTAKPLNGRGDSVPATVYWGALDTAVVAVVNDTAVLGKGAGTGRIQARVGNLRSNPVTIVVQPPLDSIRPDGALRSVVNMSGPPPDRLSDSLRVRVFPPDPPTSQTKLRRRITYQVETFQSPGPALTLLPNDTVFTDADGIAIVQVRLDAGAPPDSVRVRARSVRRDGATVPDSIPFVVEFRP